MSKVMLVNHNTDPEMVTGAEKVLLAAGLSCLERRMEVVWVSPQPGLSCDRATRMGMEVHIVDYPVLWNFVHDPSRLEEDCRAFEQAAPGSPLSRLVCAQRPDWIVTGSAINLMPAIVAHQRGVPLCWYIQEVIPGHPGLDPLMARVRQYAGRVLAPSEAVRRSLAARGVGSELTWVLPYGTDIPPAEAIRQHRRSLRLCFGWTEEHVVIGWFGSVYRGKGLLELLRASAYFRHRGKIAIVAAGNVVEADYLQQCLDEARRIAPVEWRYLGALPNIEPLLAAVDLVAIPSLVADASPNIALEAMACGRCVVAYASGGLPEIVAHGDTGYLVPNGDAAALGRTIAELAEHDGKREKAGRKGRRHAISRFGLSRFKADFVAMLHSGAERGEQQP